MLPLENQAIKSTSNGCILPALMEASRVVLTATLKEGSSDASVAMGLFAHPFSIRVYWITSITQVLQFQPWDLACGT